MNTSLIERAVEAVRKDPEITPDEQRYNEQRAEELFEGKTIWEAVR